MANVKTAISLQKSLFDQIELLAREMKTSRSRIFSLALEEFVRRRQNQQLLEKIDRAFQELDPSERKSLKQLRRSHRKIVEGEW